MKAINIGDITVVPKGTTNPYLKGYLGSVRSEALRKWFTGEPMPGFEFWFAPACGGAYKLESPKDTDVDADQVVQIWGDRRGVQK